ncbi:MAG: pyridoxamine 5'-phosphate oxidase family protein, partial [Marmoricola sp.]
MSDPTSQEKVVEIMRSDRFCMLTSVGAADQGRLHSHPMTPQEVTDEGDSWFFVDGTSEQADNVRAEKRVNLAFADGSTWLSVAGHASVLRDQAKIDELWNPVVEAWFPDGPDSQQVALLHVVGDSAEYWDSPGGRVATAVAFVKTRLTG